MPELEPWQEWEADVAKRVGGELIPQSGAGVRKLDVGSRSILVSNKWTGKESFRIDRLMLDELDSATSGSGGIGVHVVPLLAVRIEPLGRELLMGDFQSILELFTSDQRLITPTKDQMRRAEAAIPNLLRDP